MVLFRVFAACLLLWAGTVWAGPASAPTITLANVYVEGADPAGYFVSEKLDGVRGYWDGKQLLTRGGKVIVAPAWFTAGWPEHSLDGELWAGRGRFAETVSTLRSQTPNDAAWHRIRYMLFDLPDHPGPFRERVTALPEVVARIGQPWVQMIPQTPATTAAALKAQLRQVQKQGGEGLVLHRAEAPYQPGRSNDLLKYKPCLDAEARVVGHVPGKGKYTGMLGALLVETESGQRFKLGTGFTDADRRQPPPLGTWVTYRYRDITSKGLPRFASFLRVRLDRN
ncbi:MAG: DNA ligase [Georgfuchsia sp.]